MIYLLKVTGFVEDVTFQYQDIDEDNIFDEIKEHIGCTTGEVVHIMWLGERAMMVVDENGISANKNFNVLASAAYWATAMQNGFTLDQASENPLLGDVMVLTGQDQLS